MIKALSLLFFLIFALCSLVWFLLSLGLTLSQMANSAPVVGIDKGSYYLFGGAVALGALLVDGVYTSLLHKDLPPQLRKLLTRIIILGLVLIFVLPQVLHFGFKSYLDKRGYSYCEFNSQQWLHVDSLEYRNDGKCGES